MVAYANALRGKEPAAIFATRDNGYQVQDPQLAEVVATVERILERDGPSTLEPILASNV